MWSPSVTGVEVSSSKACSEREIHVSAAVSFAVLNYLYATNDTSVLSEEQKMAYLLTGVANFWANRLSWNKTKDKYEIRGKECFVADYYVCISYINHTLFKSVWDCYCLWVSLSLSSKWGKNRKKGLVIFKHTDLYYGLYTV